MCRSKDEGGRRCPGAARAASGTGSRTATAAPASRRGGRGGTRAEARARWERADHAMTAATAVVNGPRFGDRTYLLVGPLSRQAEHARAGGNPHAYDQQVAEGRAMLTSLLVSHGDSQHAAAAKVSGLQGAYATWAATPEP